MQAEKTENFPESSGMCQLEEIKGEVYRCNFDGCHKIYARESRLIIHQRTHTGDKPFKCPFEGCGKAFNEKGNLTTHKRIHTGEKPFVCPFTECGMAFKANGHLRDHIRIHTKQRPFTCDLCGKSFTRNSVLKVHRRIHTGERPYACPVSDCERRFNEKSSLKIHLVAHMKKMNSFPESCSNLSGSAGSSQALPLTSTYSDKFFAKVAMPFKIDGQMRNILNKKRILIRGKTYFKIQKSEQELQNQSKDNGSQLRTVSDISPENKTEEFKSGVIDINSTSTKCDKTTTAPYQDYINSSSAGSSLNLDDLLAKRVKVGEFNMIPEGNLANLGTFIDYLENCKTRQNGNGLNTHSDYSTGFNNQNSIFNQQQQITPITQLKSFVEKKMIENVLSLSASEGKNVYEQLISSLQNVNYNPSFYNELVNEMRKMLDQRSRLMLDNINKLISRFDNSIKNICQGGANSGAANSQFGYGLGFNTNIGFNLNMPTVNPLFSLNSIMNSPLNFNPNEGFYTNTLGFPK